MICCAIAGGNRMDLRGLVGRVLYFSRDGYALVAWPDTGRAWHPREDLYVWEPLPTMSV